MYFTMSLFGGIIPTRVFLLIFWMKGTERDERVSRFLDESDKGYAVLLFILAQRKEIKKIS